jgi:hypothetical protein
MSEFEYYTEAIARKLSAQFGDKQFGDFPSYDPKALAVVGNLVRLRDRRGVWEVTSTIGVDRLGGFEGKVRLQPFPYGGALEADITVGVFELRAVAPLEALGEQGE